MIEAAAQVVATRTASTAADALQIHETRATATFALPLQRATSKYFCGSNLAHILLMEIAKCAPVSAWPA